MNNSIINPFFVNINNNPTKAAVLSCASLHSFDALWQSLRPGLLVSDEPRCPAADCWRLFKKYLISLCESIDQPSLNFLRLPVLEVNYLRSVSDCACLIDPI